MYRKDSATILISPLIASHCLVLLNCVTYLFVDLIIIYSLLYLLFIRATIIEIGDNDAKVVLFCVHVEAFYNLFLKTV